VEQLNKKQDKIGEEAGDIWKPQPRSVSVKKSKQHYKTLYSVQAKTSNKEPEPTVLESIKLDKRDFSAISTIYNMQIPKKPKIGPTPSLIEYLKKTSPNFKERPVKCQKHGHKTHNTVNIFNPPKWTLKPVLADDFCLYFEDQNVPIPSVTIYDPKLHCIFNLTTYQAKEIYPEIMDNTKFPSKHIYYKAIHPMEHHNLLIIDSGADTSGIGGTEWIIDEITQRSVDISGYNNVIHDKKIQNWKRNYCSGPTR